VGSRRRSDDAARGLQNQQEEEEPMNARGTNGIRIGRMATTLGAATVAAALLFGASPLYAATGAAPAAAGAESAGKVDVNTASAAELASLPGIGASKAAAIIAEREKKPFASVDDLERVRGIGARTVDDLRGKVSVGGR
jgi:competence protein ComEA